MRRGCLRRKRAGEAERIRYEKALLLVAHGKPLARTVPVTIAARERSRVPRVPIYRRAPSPRRALACRLTLTSNPDWLRFFSPFVPLSSVLYLRRVPRHSSRACFFFLNRNKVANVMIANVAVAFTIVPRRFLSASLLGVPLA